MKGVDSKFDASAAVGRGERELEDVAKQTTVGSERWTSVLSQCRQAVKLLHDLHDDQGVR